MKSLYHCCLCRAMAGNALNIFFINDVLLQPSPLLITISHFLMILYRSNTHAPLPSSCSVSSSSGTRYNPIVPRLRAVYWAKWETTCLQFICAVGIRSCTGDSLNRAQSSYKTQMMQSEPLNLSLILLTLITEEVSVEEHISFSSLNQQLMFQTQ